jgi:hypothetical protein
MALVGQLKDKGKAKKVGSFIANTSSSKTVEEITESQITRPFSALVSQKQKEKIQTPSENNQTIHNPFSSLAIELSNNSPFLNGDHKKFYCMWKNLSQLWRRLK